MLGGQYHSPFCTLSIRVHANFQGGDHTHFHFIRVIRSPSSGHDRSDNRHDPKTKPCLYGPSTLILPRPLWRGPSIFTLPNRNRCLLARGNDTHFQFEGVNRFFQANDFGSGGFCRLVFLAKWFGRSFVAADARRGSGPILAHVAIESLPGQCGRSALSFSFAP